MKTKVLNITGWGRSGSTILGSILGEIDGFFYAGEVRNIWNRVLIENRLCGCGVPFKECPEWSSIFKKAFGSMDETFAREMRKLFKKHTRTRHIPIMFMPWSKGYFCSKLNPYLDNLQKLFDGIKDSTSSKVIIDSSKSTVYGYLLSIMEGVDLYIVHLVRDPRGVAYSRQKRMIQPDKNSELYMERYSPFQSSLMWDVRNITSEVLWKHNRSNYILVRYEDFIKNPQKTVSDILSLVNEPILKTPFISEDEVNLGVNHSVWGNPSRFKTGKVKLKLDEEWKEKLNPADKIISTLMTLPLLKKYNYNLN